MLACQMNHAASAIKAYSDERDHDEAEELRQQPARRQKCFASSINMIGMSSSTA